jgi:hypothetical protein
MRDTYFGRFLVIPHKAVRPKEYYKHICMEMPDIQRMKTLMIWCGSHALAKRPKTLFSRDGSVGDGESSREATKVEDNALIQEKGFISCACRF